jgi:methionyl aminopeptidase
MKRFEIEKMKKACRAAAETLRVAGQAVRPGITTDELNRIVHNDTVRRGGYPATFNYRGFPKSCCISVNDVVCHGIPGPRVLKEGDIVNVDVTTIIDGHFGDTNATFLVGDVDPKVKHMVALTERAMYAGIGTVRPGAPLNEVGRTVQNMVENHGYGVVREFGGHGIGTRFHMPPHVRHYDVGEDVVILQPGMVFTVEPMVTMGSPDVYVEPDKWTVRTADGGASSQFEETVLVTEDGVEILTKLE